MRTPELPLLVLLAALLAGCPVTDPDDDDTGDDDAADDDAADDDGADDDGADDDGGDDDGGDDDTWDPYNGDPVPGDFTLTDVNPTSASVGQDFTLSDHVGDMVVLYFAFGTCAYCTDVAATLQQQYDAHPGWHGLVQIWFVECAWCDTSTDDLIDDFHLPELLDTVEQDVWNTWSAEKGHAWLIHFDGTVVDHTKHLSETGAEAFGATIDGFIDPP